MALLDHFSTRTPAAPRAWRIGLTTYIAIWRSRRALARLDARGLDDVGISSEAAQLEARRGIWDVPDTWRNH